MDILVSGVGCKDLLAVLRLDEHVIRTRAEELQRKRGRGHTNNSPSAKPNLINTANSEQIRTAGTKLLSTSAIGLNWRISTPAFLRQLDLTSPMAAETINEGTLYGVVQQ